MVRDLACECTLGLLLFLTEMETLKLVSLSSLSIQPSLVALLCDLQSSFIPDWLADAN